MFDVSNVFGLVDNLNIFFQNIDHHTMTFPIVHNCLCFILVPTFPPSLSPSLYPMIFSWIWILQICRFYDLEVIGTFSNIVVIYKVHCVWIFTFLAVWHNVLL